MLDGADVRDLDSTTCANSIATIEQENVPFPDDSAT